MDKKCDLTMCCLQETHFKYIAIGALKVKGWKKVYHVKINFIKSRNGYI